MPRLRYGNEAEILPGEYTMENFWDVYWRAFEGDNPHTPLYGHDKTVKLSDNLDDLLNYPWTTLATVGDDTDLYGFSIALPASHVDPSRIDTEGANTAYIYYTGIMPERQGQGHVVPLMSSMFSQLVSLGYTHVERDAVIGNGYADKIEKAYSRAIVDKYDHKKYAGDLEQRFFRIDLSKLS